MDEIAEEFRKELQSLLDRYKNSLSLPNIMGVAQDVFHKTLAFKYHPELHNIAEEHLQQIINSGPSFMEKHALKEKFIAHPPVTGKWTSELNTLQQVDDQRDYLVTHKSDTSKNLHCSAQMIAEADCDGDFRKCDSACFKGCSKDCFKERPHAQISSNGR